VDDRADLGLDLELDAHRLEGQHDVGEHHGGVDAERLDRHQRHLRAQLGRLGQREDVVSLAESAVIGEAAPGIDVEVIELGWRWFEVLRIMGVSLQITITDDGDGLLGGLRGSGVPFSLNSRLEPALGRDRRTAFEYWHQDAGDAPTVLGGGSRHDELAEELGFPPTPAIGLALDMDRTAIVLKQQHPQRVRGPDVYAVPTETSSLPHVHWLVTALRQRGYKVILDASAATLETKLQKAAARGARVALMAGPALDSSGQVVVRDLQKQEQVTVWDADVADAVRRVFVTSHRHEGPIQ